MSRAHQLARSERRTPTPHVDLLNMEYINSLPQPFIARFVGGDTWEVYDIDVETGLLRINVCGRLQIMSIGEVTSFIDANGDEHDAESFYL